MTYNTLTLCMYSAYKVDYRGAAASKNNNINQKFKRDLPLFQFVVYLVYREDL